MNLILNFFLTVLSVVLLWKGSHWLIDSAVRIARKFQMSDLVIGLTIVAMGTSAPEFAVSINAALRGLPDISVSNVVGSNIFNLGFILGGCAAIREIKTTPSLVWRDSLFLLCVSFLLVFMFRDLTLSPKEGIVLLACLILYLAFLFRSKVPLEEMDAGEEATGRDILFFLLGIAAVVGGGHLLVHSAVALARFFGISEWVIGVTIVAAGTSTPEFATSLVAALKGRYGISAGNLIGSDLFNLLGVLGLAGTLRPLTIDQAGLGSLYILVGMVLLVVVFMRTGYRVSRVEGFTLVGVSLVRWIYDFWGQM
ncbi:MAG: sodium:calcium antiporter [Deltaproteobacteria bacterium]|nr:sodium:calcium antiporter [Deltaproteobacteria bacterium]